MIELRHLDIRHFVIEECSHLANGCTTKCDCTGLMSFHYYHVCNNERCKYYKICFGIRVQSVTLWLQVVQPFTRRPRTKNGRPTLKVQVT